MSSSASAESLIAEIARRYAEMSSYQDEGEVLQALDAGAEPIRTRFTTHFRRPGLFRFAFASPHPFPLLAHVITEHVSGADKRGAYAWTKTYEEDPEIEDEVSLSMAVAGATGISGGAAHTIGSLLIPEEVGGLSISELRDASIIGGGETFDGADCLLISAPHPIGGEISLWVERKTFILRKVRTDLRRFPPGEEIRRSIIINQVIDDGVFERPSCET